MGAKDVSKMQSEQQLGVGRGWLTEILTSKPNTDLLNMTSITSKSKMTSKLAKSAYLKS